MPPRPSVVTVSRIRSYSNLDDSGACRSTRKSYKTSHIVDWVVVETVMRFPCEA